MLVTRLLSSSHAPQWRGRAWIASTNTSTASFSRSSFRRTTPYLCFHTHTVYEQLFLCIIWRKKVYTLEEGSYRYRVNPSNSPAMCFLLSSTLSSRKASFRTWPFSRGPAATQKNTRRFSVKGQKNYFQFSMYWLKQISPHPGCPQSHRLSFFHLTVDKEGHLRNQSLALQLKWKHWLQLQRLSTCQVPTDPYQIARIHIEEISLLTAAALQKVGSTIILFQVKVGFGQCKCIEVLCIFLYLEQTIKKKSHPNRQYKVISITVKQSNWKT